ncbi:MULTISPECIES: DUF3077 domain-containing protein [unclassified Pseudomonas]|jgi:hypothetical protein|uniref:DUF3077 domain-containing protein n=1 Tax=unclassified Pseudomonas TaxID=196821 RepID=UPI000BA3E6ED|nr:MULTISPECIES: DUF3077 domain-containing protein [unclassified Pseudomonas]MCU1724388.1 DUF3077 domain-containing protein [Pseudomonas sp. 5P_5.1_Bac1]MCU1732944.1 DUF3077 domain-containing protein [Pseudomonas sp. 20P_3.2_Bac4]MCU1742390.1 DUF3077 domain-containing protein [Pseudomonas sp. 20P_3.2_Bac5]
MIKIVPDPPAPRLTTAHTRFSTCNDSHQALFAVCEGVDIEDALVHLSTTLRSAFETNAQLCEMIDTPPLDRVAWATCHSLEICEALVESLLGRVERPQVR